MVSGYSWVELVEMAIQVEKAGESYYRRAAAKTGGEMRSAFKALADAERQHAEVFHSLLPKGVGEGTKGISPEEAKPYVKQLLGASLLRYLTDSQNGERAMGGPMEILEFALGFEEESVKFYASLRGHATKVDVVERIIGEEKKHIDRIKQMMNSLA